MRERVFLVDVNESIRYDQFVVISPNSVYPAGKNL